MTKSQKIIVMAAVVLIMSAILFPPYFSSYGTSGNHVMRNGGWTFIGTVAKVESRGNYRGIRFDILGIEIFGILVLAGAALLITKKR